MNPTLRNVLSVILGLFAGSAINMTIIVAGSTLIPPPAGADVTTMEGLKAALPMFEAKHFIMPFLAHAVGTLTGAYIIARLAKTAQSRLCMVLGIFFLLGGLYNAIILPAPLWFKVFDVVFAYIPMAYLGYKTVSPQKPATQVE